MPEHSVCSVSVFTLHRLYDDTPERHLASDRE